MKLSSFNTPSLPPSCSETIELQWEKEMALLEQENLAQEEEPKADPETDVFLQNLDNELNFLIQVCTCVSHDMSYWSGDDHVIIE